MILLAAALTAAPVGNSPQEGFGAAVAACEKWIMDPATWADHINEFPKRSGLGDNLQPQSGIPDVALPAPQLRQGLHSWRVPVGTGGYFLTVSDRIPFCHIAGGGTADFEPGTEAALRAMVAAKRWAITNESRKGELLSTELVNSASKRFTMIVSRAASAGQRTDRVQVLATAQFNIDDQK